MPPAAAAAASSSAGPPSAPTSAAPPRGGASAEISPKDGARELAAAVEVEIEITPGDVGDRYAIDRSRGPIGRGAAGTVVWRAVDRSRPGRKCAVKSVSKSMPDAAFQLSNLRREVALLRWLDHPSVQPIYDVFEDGEHLHLVTGLCEGGELYDLVMDQKHRRKARDKTGLGRNWERETAVPVVRQILWATAHCHERKIVHRDLKLENVLLKTKYKPGKAKSKPEVCLIDFGLAAAHNPKVAPPLADIVGTPHYMAPEVLDPRAGYGDACDVWSLGVLTYTLLSAKAPFRGETNEEVYAAIRSEDAQAPEFPDRDWGDVSDAAKEFVRRALVRDPERRPTAAELLEDPWIREGGGGREGGGDEMDGAAAKKKTSRMQKLKRLLHGTLATEQ